MSKNDKIIFERPATILMFAFRYALGRMTVASMTVADDIVENWSRLNLGLKIQIKREITEAVLHNVAGMQCDIDQWQRVLDLPITEKETVI